MSNNLSSFSLLFLFLHLFSRYDILKQVIKMGNAELSDVFAEYNKGDLSSYLIDITAKLLKKKDSDHPSEFLVDMVRDSACEYFYPHPFPSSLPFPSPPLPSLPHDSLFSFSSHLFVSFSSFHIFIPYCYFSPPFLFLFSLPLPFTP